MLSMLISSRPLYLAFVHLIRKGLRLCGWRPRRFFHDLWTHYPGDFYDGILQWVYHLSLGRIYYRILMMVLAILLVQVGGPPYYIFLP